MGLSIITFGIALLTSFFLCSVYFFYLELSDVKVTPKQHIRFVNSVPTSKEEVMCDLVKPKCGMPPEKPEEIVIVQEEVQRPKHNRVAQHKEFLDKKKKRQCSYLDLVKYWQEPSESDILFETDHTIDSARRAEIRRTGKHSKSGLERYLYHDEQYITFEPDEGGWNNVRMQMEIVMVLALVTGRTLVIPFDQPLYLLNSGRGHENVHNFADYFPMDWIKQRLSVITMQEFLRREALTGNLYDYKSTLTSPVSEQLEFNIPYNVTNTFVSHSNKGTPIFPPGNKTEFDCGIREEKLKIFGYLRSVGACPHWHSAKQYLVIPYKKNYNITEELKRNANGPLALSINKRQTVFAGTRTPIYYDRFWRTQKVIHFVSKGEFNYRLFQHFYTFIFAEDETLDHFMKRFVRDYVYYVESIFCRAALIVNKLKSEAIDGKYSAFHVRRGDLQYKEVKIPSADLLKNVGEFIPQNQLLYIATDVKEKEYFNDLKSRFPKLRFLDDYRELAGLADINPNMLGMIDQIVCTRGEIFVGTWFSTFSGYIARLRGYLGYEDASNLYGDMGHRDRMRTPEVPKFPYYMREWNESWWRIDDDTHANL